MNQNVVLDRSLRSEGIDAAAVCWNLPVAALYEEAVRRREGVIAAEGPLVCRTGKHTGRSPNDKFIVRDMGNDSGVAWGNINQPMDAKSFEALTHDFLASLAGSVLFVQDCFAAADARYRLPVRVITTQAWHNLFARHLLIVDPDNVAASVTRPRLTIIDSPDFQPDRSRHGTRSDVVIAVNLERRLVLIGGTGYAGEIKKSVFTVLNYLLPREDVLSMHCSANVGPQGDAAIFFGLSGTGKTTLSSDPGRRLIGDDEHAWSDQGIFNIEGGCYAKTIRLSARDEPQIYAATRRFGTVLENVGIDEATRRLDLDDDRLTENTRAAYPISFIDNAELSGTAGHPRHIIMLTADAFGLLPPVSRLTPEGAVYHFLSGYTAKVAGTEQGVTEPKATFSACFGAPFLPLAPTVYASMLRERIRRHRVQAWLVNTGWTGGPSGVGRRMPIQHTRAMIRAVLGGKLDDVQYDRDPIFNVDVPSSCPDVPSNLLRPRGTWQDEKEYTRRASKLASMFAENFRAFEGDVTPGIRAAGPLSRSS
jgi:phosphoenolpyruvate carboxykinase (ATP)